jgi:hypothetical protein
MPLLRGGIFTDDIFHCLVMIVAPIYVKTTLNVGLAAKYRAIAAKCRNSPYK